MHSLITNVLGASSLSAAGFLNVPPDMTDGIANPVYIHGNRVGTVTQNGALLEFNFEPQIVVPNGVCMEVWVQAPPATCDPIEPPDTSLVSVEYIYTHKRVDPCE